MNDDLNILVTFLSTNKDMVKSVIVIERGMNEEEWKNWQYFREPEINKLLLDAMPLYVRTFCSCILAVEEVFSVKIPNFKKTCTWTAGEEDTGIWETSCKETFLLMEDTPKENSFKFCCYCGEELREGNV